MKNSVDPDDGQISWLHQKPADLDLHCFQKRKNNFKKKFCMQCTYRGKYHIHG